MDLALERVRLLERDAEWAALASEGRDAERVLSYWADDAVLLPPGRPGVAGKAELREYVKHSLSLPGFNITWTPMDAFLSPDGNLAYVFDRNAVTVNGPDGTPVTSRGRGVTVWRREPDGEFRCVVDIWNAEPEAENAPGISSRQKQDTVS